MSVEFMDCGGCNLACEFSSGWIHAIIYYFTQGPVSISIGGMMLNDIPYFGMFVWNGVGKV